MAKLNIKASEKPKAVKQEKWYIVRISNILKPQLLWTEYSSQTEAKIALEKAHRIKGLKKQNYEVMYGYIAKKYRLKFVTLSPLRNKLEHAPVLPKIKYLYPTECLKDKRAKYLYRARMRTRYKREKQNNY